MNGKAREQKQPTPRALRDLAIRLAWILIADDSECTCALGDECPLCHAKRVLGRDMPSNTIRGLGGAA